MPLLFVFDRKQLRSPSTTTTYYDNMSRISTILCLFVVALATASAFTVSNSNPVRASTELEMTVLARGAKKMNFKAGSPLKNACAKLGVKPKYSCKK